MSSIERKFSTILYTLHAWQFIRYLKKHVHRSLRDPAVAHTKANKLMKECIRIILLAENYKTIEEKELSSNSDFKELFKKFELPGTTPEMRIEIFRIAKENVKLVIENVQTIKEFFGNFSTYIQDIEHSIHEDFEVTGWTTRVDAKIADACRDLNGYSLTLIKAALMIFYVDFSNRDRLRRQVARSQHESRYGGRSKSLSNWPREVFRRFSQGGLFNSFSTIPNNDDEDEVLVERDRGELNPQVQQMSNADRNRTRRMSSVGSSIPRSDVALNPSDIEELEVRPTRSDDDDFY